MIYDTYYHVKHIKFYWKINAAQSDLYVNHNMGLLANRLYERFSDPLEKFIWHITANRIESFLGGDLYL